MTMKTNAANGTNDNTQTKKETTMTKKEIMRAIRKVNRVYLIVEMRTNYREVPDGGAEFLPRLRSIRISKVDARKLVNEAMDESDERVKTMKASVSEWGDVHRALFIN